MDLYEFQTILVYTASSRSARAMQQGPVSRENWEKEKTLCTRHPGSREPLQRA